MKQAKDFYNNQDLIIFLSPTIKKLVSDGFIIHDTKRVPVDIDGNFDFINSKGRIDSCEKHGYSSDTELKNDGKNWSNDAEMDSLIAMKFVKYEDEKVEVGWKFFNQKLKDITQYILIA